MSEIKTNKTSGAGVSRWLKHVTVLVVVVIAGIAFWISFIALADLGALAIPAYQSWGLPVIVDGMIITGTLATVMMHGRESKRPRVYAWAILIGGAVLSVVANALHGAIPADWVAPAGVKATIASIPPLGLLLMTHLLVMISRRVEDKKPRRKRRATPAPLPVAAPTPTPATIEAPAAQDKAAGELQAPGGPGVGDVPQTAPAAQGTDPESDLAGWVRAQLGSGVPERSLTRLLVQEAGISESTARRRLNELRDTGQFPDPKQETSRLRVVAQ